MRWEPIYRGSTAGGRISPTSVTPTRIGSRFLDLSIREHRHRRVEERPVHHLVRNPGQSRRSPRKETARLRCAGWALLMCALSCVRSSASSPSVPLVPPPLSQRIAPPESPGASSRDVHRRRYRPASPSAMNVCARIVRSRALRARRRRHDATRLVSVQEHARIDRALMTVRHDRQRAWPPIFASASAAKTHALCDGRSRLSNGHVILARAQFESCLGSGATGRPRHGSKRQWPSSPSCAPEASQRRHGQCECQSRRSANRSRASKARSVCASSSVRPVVSHSPTRVMRTTNAACTR
jgi:hypothetical protein